MDKRQDEMIGRRFGKLVVEAFDRYEGGFSFWRCRCDCGGEKVVNRKYLMNGHTFSCGCQRGVRGQYNPEAFVKRGVPPEAEEWIIRHYKHTKNDEIMQRWNISDGSLHRFARKHGLKKSPQFRKKCQAAATEAANLSHIAHGTYPKKGYVIPRSEEFRYKPGHKDTRTQEQKERAQATRRESIADDRRRILFGLPQKTKVKLTKQPHKKICQRLYLRRHGYLIERGSSIAYYTPETRRVMTYENRRAGDKDYQYFDYRPYGEDKEK